MPIFAASGGLLTDALTLSRNLKRLLQVRSVLILCQAGLVLLSVLMPEMRLKLWPMLAIIAGYALVNGVAFAIYRGRGEISERAYFGQLILDVAFLSLLLYFSGGYTNPLISLYLLPLIIAIATLPRIYGWSMAVLVLACYSLLVFFYQPLFVGAHNHGGHTADTGFQLHLSGMWFSFVLSVALIVFFIMRMSDALREREKHLADLREKSARDELVVALGALAAGAAHELGTPLSTMAVVAGELAHDYADDAEAVGRLQILRDQIKRCREILSQISASAGEMRAEEGRSIAVEDYVCELLEQWESTLPGAEVSVEMQEGASPPLVVDVTLTQALISILNNAADASPGHIGLSCRWSDEVIEIEINDEGPGLPEELKAQIGTPFVSSKSGGRGLGLFLGRAVIERLGGSLILSDRKPGGVSACVCLPRSRFAAVANDV